MVTCILLTIGAAILGAIVAAVAWLYLQPPSPPDLTGDPDKDADDKFY